MSRPAGKTYSVLYWMWTAARVILTAWHKVFFLLRRWSWCACFLRVRSCRIGLHMVCQGLSRNCLVLCRLAEARSYRIGPGSIHWHWIRVCVVFIKIILHSLNSSRTPLGFTESLSSFDCSFTWTFHCGFASVTVTGIDSRMHCSFDIINSQPATLELRFLSFLFLYQSAYTTFFGSHHYHIIVIKITIIYLLFYLSITWWRENCASVCWLLIAVVWTVTADVAIHIMFTALQTCMVWVPETAIFLSWLLLNDECAFESVKLYTRNSCVFVIFFFPDSKEKKNRVILVIEIDFKTTYSDMITADFFFFTWCKSWHGLQKNAWVTAS